LIWLVLVSLSLALWQSCGRIRLYLLSCLLADAILFPLGRFAKDTSHLYAWAYAVLTGLILLVVAWIVLEALRKHQNSWKALGIVGVLSVALGRAAMLGIGHTARYYDWIGILEGCCLFAAGLTYGCLAPYLERTSIALVLSGLWLSQSFFRIGYYVLNPAWAKWNWRIPPIIGTCGFLLIALLSRQREAAPHPRLPFSDRNARHPVR
jgi:hypothetical protein